MQVPSRPLSPTAPTSTPTRTQPPLTRSQSAPSLLTPSQAKPSSSQVARSGDTQQQQALTSPETVQTVASKASQASPSQLQENASANSDLQSSLMASVIPEAPLAPDAPVSTVRRGPNLSNVSNIVRTDHVINTHIIQNAQFTPEVRQMRGQLKDLDLSVTQLNNRMTALADTINEIEASRPPVGPMTRDQHAVLKDAKQQVALVERQLTQALSQRNALQNRIAEATSAPAPDHGHVNTVWENTKSTYIETQDSQSDFFMGVAIDFRKQVMDTLVTQAADSLSREATALNPDSPAPRTLTKAVGSMALTSDRDINVTVRGAEIGSDTNLVNTVNSQFRTLFGQDSGTYFDTNLYNEGLMPDIDRIKAGQPVDVWNDPVASRVNDQQQDLVALVKQRRFFTGSEEWNANTAAVVTAMGDQGASTAQIEAFKAQCGEADAFVVRAETLIHERVERNLS
ncbi:MAG: hypothetical protein CVV27_15590 [Candidatus Melainabacteria bacterium HGW-Melainabacteria-1]|nr:MAG: hypothetical protein CVV27_15590 [Candidatus Melainabacteria bacterium HGW-Melainabacteria-1]